MICVLGTINSKEYWRHRGKRLRTPWTSEWGRCIVQWSTGIVGLLPGKQTWQFPCRWQASAARLKQIQRSKNGERKDFWTLWFDAVFSSFISIYSNSTFAFIDYLEKSSCITFLFALHLSLHLSINGMLFSRASVIFSFSLFQQIIRNIFAWNGETHSLYLHSLNRYQ